MTEPMKGDIFVRDVGYDEITNRALRDAFRAFLDANSADRHEMSMKPFTLTTDTGEKLDPAFASEPVEGLAVRHENEFGDHIFLEVPLVDRIALTHTSPRHAGSPAELVRTISSGAWYRGSPLVQLMR